MKNPFLPITQAARLFLLAFAILLSTPLVSRAVPLDTNGVSLSSNEQSIVSSMAGSGQHRAFLRVDPILTAVARARAQDLGSRGYFDHVNPNGVGPNYLVRAAGYPLPDWWGTDPKANYIESIAAGFSGAGDTWNAWMKSDPHRTHLLAEDSFFADQTSVGVAEVTVSGSPYTYYWVVITAPPRPDAPLKITAPSANFKVTTPSITATGTASDESGATKVEYANETSAGLSAYSLASGVSKWQATVNLSRGRNLIHARSRDAGGKVIAEVVRKVTFVEMSPLTVTSSSGGTVSGNFAGVTSRELDATYTITARPSDGYIFAGWSGSADSADASLTFVMAEGFTLQANFVPNPFPATAGGYQTLIETTAGVGFMKIHSTGKGRFIGRLILNGEKMSFHGRLAADGTAEITLPNSDGLSLALRMSVNGDNAPLAATLSDPSSSVALSFDRDVYNAKTNPAPNAGQYSLVFTPQTATTNLSNGNPVDGDAKIVIDQSGNALIRGHLSDGSAFTASSFITTDGRLSVYAKLNGNTGSLAGELQFIEGSSDEVQGTLTWFQAPTKTSTSFTHTLKATGNAL